MNITKNPMGYNKHWSSKAQCPICKRGEVVEPHNINKCDDCISNIPIYKRGK